MPPHQPHTTALPKQVTGLDAFIFDGKYLFDATLQADLSLIRDDGVQLIKLDGLQRDRLHVTQALRDAYPLIATVLDSMHGQDHGRIKILVIDFVYYVMQHHAFQPGHVVVPINQQSNDVRARNLTVLPGTGRKDYRGTDVVPRDGISLGSVTRYLPRSVTVCKAGLPGRYNFKLTDEDGKRKVFGFAPEDAPDVYLDKVVPELVARDPGFHERDVVYQDLCRTYFMAFPGDATTLPPPPVDPPAATTSSPPRFYPRGKEQLELKKRVRDEALARAAALPAGMRECRTCATVMSVDGYDDSRLECKACRKESRAVHDATVVHDPDVHPEVCSECGIGFSHELFLPRGRGYRGTCRECINGKGYSEAYRERERENDLTGYLQRNAATHLDWAHRHPEAQREQQRKAETEPDRAFMAILTNARARNVHVDEACASVLKTKLSMACHYCDFTPTVGEHLNGLDRVDSDVGYTDANTVSCCSTCNIMKGCHEMHEFIYIMRRIRVHRSLAQPDGISRRRLPGFGGWAELRAAPAKEKNDLLSSYQRLRLWSSPCYLCGRAPALGIDRLDSAGDYTEDNARPCCSDCNYAKKHLDLTAFLGHVAQVCAHTDAWVLSDVMDAPLRGNTREVRQAVAMVADDGMLMLVFPSIGKAASMIRGLDENNLRRALDSGGKHRGFRWQRATPRMYRMQNCEMHFCNDLLTSAST